MWRAHEQKRLWNGLLCHPKHPETCRQLSLCVDRSQPLVNRHAAAPPRLGVYSCIHPGLIQYLVSCSWDCGSVEHNVDAAFTAGPNRCTQMCGDSTLAFGVQHVARHHRTPLSTTHAPELRHAVLQMSRIFVDPLLSSIVPIRIQSHINGLNLLSTHILALIFCSPASMKKHELYHACMQCLMLLVPNMLRECPKTVAVRCSCCPSFAHFSSVSKSSTHAALAISDCPDVPFPVSSVSKSSIHAALTFSDCLGVQFPVNVCQCEAQHCLCQVAPPGLQLATSMANGRTRASGLCNQVLKRP